MTVKPNDIVSRKTQISTRNIWFALLGIFIAKRYSVSESNWPFNLVNEPLGAFDEVAKIVLIALLINHTVNWVSDYKIYLNWFSISEVPKGGFHEIVDVEGLTPVLQGLRARVAMYNELSRSYLPSKAETGDGITNLQESTKSLAKSVELLQSSQEQILFITRQLHNKFRNTNSYVRFMVFIWNFVLPVSAGLMGTFIVFFDVPIARDLND